MLQHEAFQHLLFFGQNLSVAAAVGLADSSSKLSSIGRVQGTISGGNFGSLATMTTMTAAAAAACCLLPVCLTSLVVLTCIAVQVLQGHGRVQHRRRALHRRHRVRGGREGGEYHHVS